MNRIDFYDAVEETLAERLEEEYPGLELERKHVDKTSGSYEGVIFKDPDMSNMCPTITLDQVREFYMGYMGR